VRRQHGEEVEVRMFIDTRALPLMVMSGDVWGCRVVRAREGKVVLLCSSEGLIQRRMLLPCPALPPAYLPGPARLARERVKSLFSDWGRPKAASAFLAQEQPSASHDSTPTQNRSCEAIPTILPARWKHVRWARGVNVLRASGLAAACSLLPELATALVSLVMTRRWLTCLHCTVRTAQQRR
jgi:hypothetical protein